MSIPDEAVEAAAKAQFENRLNEHWCFADDFQKDRWREDSREAFEAAATFLQAEAWDEGAAARRDIHGDITEDNPYREGNTK